MRGKAPEAAPQLQPARQSHTRINRAVNEGWRGSSPGSMMEGAGSSAPTTVNPPDEKPPWVIDASAGAASAAGSTTIPGSTSGAAVGWLDGGQGWMGQRFCGHETANAWSADNAGSN